MGTKVGYFKFISYSFIIFQLHNLSNSNTLNMASMTSIFRLYVLSHSLSKIEWLRARNMTRNISTILRFPLKKYYLEVLFGS